MINEGCLSGIDEIYGMHNWPSHPPPYIMVKAGPVMSEISSIDITLIGKGGSFDKIDELINPLDAAIDFHIKFR